MKINFENIAEDLQEIIDMFMEENEYRNYKNFVSHLIDSRNMAMEIDKNGKTKKDEQEEIKKSVHERCKTCTS